MSKIPLRVKMRRAFWSAVARRSGDTALAGGSEVMRAHAFFSRHVRRSDESGVVTPIGFATALQNGKAALGRHIRLASSRSFSLESRNVRSRLRAAPGPNQLA